MRPTLDRVREALFSILGDLTGTSVLDLFAGTGALGIEALSRGASSAVFVEHDPPTLELIRSNLEVTGLTQRARVRALRLPQDLARLSAEGAPFDLILMDAPYEGNARDRTLAHPHLPLLLAAGGRLVVEHDVRRPPAFAVPALEVTDQRRYGATALVFFEHASTPHEAR